MKTHLVTGSSYGIGAAVVKRLLMMGDNVIGISRTDPPNSSTHHKRFSWCCADLMDEDHIRDTVKAINVKIDTVTFAAGRQQRNSSQWDLNQWRMHMEINCFGQAYLFEELEREGKLVGLPSVVVLGSHASTGSSWAPAYAMSKAAFWAYWRSKYAERKGNLIVNQIWPGRVDTPGNPKRDLPVGDKNVFRTTDEIAGYVSAYLEMDSPDAPRLNTLDLGIPVL